MQVLAETTHINTTDASLGNAISREQIRNLPIEAQNVVQLLSLQPGAVFIPCNANSGRQEDPRYGSVAGARADQQNVTLDGVDVNDPQIQTAYTSAVRMTQEALQEFRVSTAQLQRRQRPLERPAGVARDRRAARTSSTAPATGRSDATATSSNEYFLKLAQLQSGKESQAPKLDKDIYGGAFGGPIRATGCSSSATSSA